jgi:hypothetical protein
VVIPCLLVAIVPLIPVVQPGTPGPTASTLFGVDASNVRTLGIAGLALVGIGLIAASARSNHRGGHRGVIGALLALALVGVGAAVYNAGGFTGGRDGFGVLQLLPQMAGQPLIYALLLLLFVGVLSHDPAARHKLLVAWAVVVLVEAAVVAGQLASGNAYDAVRGITRGQGTMGANFLGAFALFGIFGGMYLREITRSTAIKWLATASLVAACGTMIASISRGALLGFGFALVALLVMRTRHSIITKRLAAVVLLAVIVGGSLNVMSGLWSQRLGDPVTRQFDRPASWVSGVRITEDNPIAGVGSLNVASAVTSVDRYNSTPFGPTESNPHNSWIFAFAAGGLAYGGLLLVSTVLFARGIWRRPTQAGEEYLRAGLLGVSLVFMVNNLFTHPEIMIFVLLVGALLMVEPKRPSRLASRLASSSGSLVRPTTVG